ncbi:MAG: D-glycero-beta-D-manno-heptose-7-phosphate kinase [Acidobacteriota bacterium]|nr:D-glycero-beta-D-manno-heptose-7-phosphate kinase [Acidobacteriota bacterium]
MIQPEEKRLIDLVREFTRRRVVVVGDAVADQFLYGEISRVSREAPVLILRHERTETVPGGAANCANNLASLGAQSSLVAVVGEDEAGRALVAKLNEAGVDCRGIVADGPPRTTTTKMRVLAGHAHSIKQQVIRVDYEGTQQTSATLAAVLCARLREVAVDADALIISDYNYGVASNEVVGTLRELARERGIPVLVDSRFRLTEFVGFTSATPNEDEVEHTLGARLEDARQLEDAASQLLARLRHRALLITRGKQGMLLAEAGMPLQHFAAVGERDAVDVTGAGDTVIATYALALASGATFTEAARLANHAGGIVVMKRGTACVTADELLASLSGSHDK